jgi:hypothetical protein
MVRSSRLAEVVCIGADVPAYYETVIIYCRFLLISPSKSLGLNLRPKKARSRLGTLSGLILVYCVRPERDPKETRSRPKRDLFATSAT